MSRKVQMLFGCDCGEEFEAWVYESINVSVDPELKDLIFTPRFNTVVCPACGVPADANIPFSYHDMERKFWMLVCPEKAADYEEDVRKSFVEEIEQFKKDTIKEEFEEFLENSGLKNYKILFGRYKLIEFLLENDPDPSIRIQYKHFFNGIKHYDQGDLQRAIELWNMAIKADPGNCEIVAQAYFNIACAECKKGHMDDVASLLDIAIKNGIEPELVRFDPDIAEFRKDPRFNDILKKLLDAEKNFKPPMGL